MKLRKVDNHGYKHWLAEIGVREGKRRRSYRSTKAEAEAELAQAKKDEELLGRAWANLPARARADVVRILDDMAANGLTLAQVWEAYREAKLRPAETTDRTLGAAIIELMALKKTENCRDRYLDSLYAYLRLFAKGREGMPVDRITPGDIERWFDGRKEAVSTRHSNLGRLGSLFTMCVRRGYRLDNPCVRVARIRQDQKAPTILTLRQCAKILLWTRARSPENLGWVVLGLLGGLRPEESYQVTWKHADFNAGVVRVDSDTTKVRMRRLVHLHQNALEWLKVARAEGAVQPIKPQRRRRWLRQLRERLFLEAWPQDVLRHTAASNWLAHWQDAGKVAHELGNSAGILLKHYRQLVTKDDAETFWGFYPKTPIGPQLLTK